MGLLRTFTLETSSDDRLLVQENSDGFIVVRKVGSRSRIELTLDEARQLAQALDQLL